MCAAILVGSGLMAAAEPAGDTIAPEELESLPDLTLLVRGAALLSPEATEAMIGELRLVFGNTTLGWVDMDQTEEIRATGTAVVVRLNEVSMPGGKPPSRSTALGETAVTNGQVLRFVNLYCDRVRLLLAPAIRKRSEAERERAVGHAMGLVLAHELYHALTRSLAHNTGGIMKPQFNCHDLLSKSLQFQSHERAEIVLRLKPQPVPQLTARRR